MPGTPKPSSPRKCRAPSGQTWRRRVAVEIAALDRDVASGPAPAAEGACEAADRRQDGPGTGARPPDGRVRPAVAVEAAGEAAQQEPVFERLDPWPGGAPRGPG